MFFRRESSIILERGILTKKNVKDQFLTKKGLDIIKKMKEMNIRANER